MDSGIVVKLANCIPACLSKQYIRNEETGMYWYFYATNRCNFTKQVGNGYRCLPKEGCW